MKCKSLRISVSLLMVSLFFLLTGCEAFVRKFSHKPKKDTQGREEMVLVPEEYMGPLMSKEELYRQHFLFWKSWHEELISSLSGNTNRKKQLDSAEEAIGNLKNLKTLLNKDKQQKLDVYISRLESLKGTIAKDLYNNNATRNRDSAERIKQNILREFSYNHVKDYLI